MSEYIHAIALQRLPYHINRPPMTPEEKFINDLGGCFVFKMVLRADEIAELNGAIDAGSYEGRRCSHWREPFKQLIDDPDILPYLLELIGP